MDGKITVMMVVLVFDSSQFVVISLLPLLSKVTVTQLKQENEWIKSTSLCTNCVLLCVFLVFAVNGADDSVGAQQFQTDASPLVGFLPPQNRSADVA